MYVANNAHMKEKYIWQQDIPWALYLTYFPILHIQLLYDNRNDFTVNLHNNVYNTKILHKELHWAVYTYKRDTYTQVKEGTVVFKSDVPYVTNNYMVEKRVRILFSAPVF